KRLRRFGCSNCSVTKIDKLNKNINKYQNNLNDIGLPVNIIPEYFHGTIKKSKFKCNKCNNIFTGYYNNLIQNKRNTCKCNFKVQKDEKYYKDKLDDNYIMIDNTFQNSLRKCKFKHLKCGN